MDQSMSQYQSLKTEHPEKCQELHWDFKQLPPSSSKGRKSGEEFASFKALLTTEAFIFINFDSKKRPKMSVFSKHKDVLTFLHRLHKYLKELVKNQKLAMKSTDFCRGVGKIPLCFWHNQPKKRTLPSKCLICLCSTSNKVL